MIYCLHIVKNLTLQPFSEQVLYFFIYTYIWAFAFISDRTAEDKTGNGGEREGEWHAAKGLRTESHPGLLQQELIASVYGTKELKLNIWTAHRKIFDNPKTVHLLIQQVMLFSTPRLAWSAKVWCKPFMPKSSIVIQKLLSLFKSFVHTCSCCLQFQLTMKCC